MNSRSGPGPFDPKPVSILRTGGNRPRARGAVAILLAGGVLASTVAAEDAVQTGMAPTNATPLAADPVFGAFSSLHARQQWLEAEIARHQDRLAEAASAYIAVQGALQEKEAVVAELREQIVRLEAAHRETEDARRLLTAENAKFAATLARERIGAEADAQLSSDRLKALQKRMSELEAEGIATRSRFVELEQGRDRALSANLFLQAEKRALEGEVERHTQTRAELTRRIESLEASLEATKTEQKILRDEKDKLAADLARSEHPIDDLSLELGRTQGGRQQQRVRVDALVETLSSLEAQLAEQSLAANEARARAEQAETRLAGLEASSTECESRSAALQASLDAAEDEVARLEAQRSAQLPAVEGAAVDERRSAEEMAELAVSLATARETAADAERRLKVVEEIQAGAVVAVERLQQDKAELQTSLEAEREKAAALRATIEEIRSRGAESARQDEAAVRAAAEMDRLATEKQALTDELARLVQTSSDAGRAAQERLAAKESEIGDLNRQLGELRAMLGRTESKLTSVRERVPSAAGGAATDEQLRLKAAAQMQALREHDKRRGEMDGARWKDRRADLEQAVYDEQLMLAEFLSARGVHRVQRDDTLAGISRNAYGRSNRWKEIFEANRHLLDDPDRVFPGMTLIIP